jgi:hypothetical protein
LRSSTEIHRENMALEFSGLDALDHAPAAAQPLDYGACSNHATHYVMAVALRHFGHYGVAPSARSAAVCPVRH